MVPIGDNKRKAVGGGLSARRYAALLSKLLAHVRRAKAREAAGVAWQIPMYRAIGREIDPHQRRGQVTDAVMWRLVKDIRKREPTFGTFTACSLYSNTRFYREHKELPGEQMATFERLTWAHCYKLMQKEPDLKARLWYARQAVERNWSVPVMLTNVGRQLHQRLGRSINNFGRTMGRRSRAAATKAFRHPYILDFPGLRRNCDERGLEEVMMRNLYPLLEELGPGFTLVGRQYVVRVGRDAFQIDLLFYHLQLRRLIVVDLKCDPFMVQFAGKLTFYCALVDEQVPVPGGRPALGLVICPSVNERIAQAAVDSMARPMAVCGYRLTAEG